MSVSNFTSATFAVVKKYTQLACIFISKISHRKNTLKFACKKSACKSSFKNINAFFWLDFLWKSAILHTIYVRVSAAMPVACTVLCSQKYNVIVLVGAWKIFSGNSLSLFEDFAFIIQCFRFSWCLHNYLHLQTVFTKGTERAETKDKSESEEAMQTLWLQHDSSKL